MTLPEFLGLTALGELVCGGLDRLRNRLGMLFPGLEAKPAVLALTDPANLDPNAPPAVQAAAGVKAEKDAAAQKVKAIRYLATIGCSTCYPDVEKGLLEATKDCTEEVRYEAVKALRETAGNPCNTCRENSCCTVAVMQRLYQIAFEGDEQGCPLEPSGRVRRVARLALNRCGCPVAGGAGGMGAPDEGPLAEPMPEDVPPPEPTPDAMAGGSQLPWRAGLAASDASFVQPAGFSPVVARVNGQPIALDEVLSRVDRRIAADHPQATLADREHLRQTLLREELQRAIDTRLLCDEARQNLPPQEIARVVYDPQTRGLAGWGPESSGRGSPGGRLASPFDSDGHPLRPPGPVWLLSDESGTLPPTAANVLGTSRRAAGPRLVARRSTGDPGPVAIGDVGRCGPGPFRIEAGRGPGPGVPVDPLVEPAAGSGRGRTAHAARRHAQQSDRGRRSPVSGPCPGQAGCRGTDSG